METVPEDAEGMHLVKNAAELVAATHVADGHHGVEFRHFSLGGAVVAEQTFFFHVPSQAFGG